MFKTFLSGAAIGVANLLPGVSGGTIAVILNIYDTIILSINEVLWHKKNRKKHLLFLTLLFLGASVSILVFSHLIYYLLDHFPRPFYAYLAGLIIGSIPIIAQKHLSKLSFPNSIAFLLSFLFIGWLSFQTQSLMTSYPSMIQTLFFILAGLIAASTMIIPGISGSLILILLGFYTPLLNAIKTIQFDILIPVGIGAIIGLIGTSKLIGYLLKKYPSLTYYGIVGLLVGSLIKLSLEGQLVSFEGHHLIATLSFCALGFVTTTLLERV